VNLIYQVDYHLFSRHLYHDSSFCRTVENSVKRALSHPSIDSGAIGYEANFYERHLKRVLVDELLADYQIYWSNLEKLLPNADKYIGIFLKIYWAWQNICCEYC
jgi:hypothetical protein